MYTNVYKTTSKNSNRRPTETFALIGGAIDKHFGRDDMAKRHKHLHQLSVTKLLWQVVDEQVAAVGSTH